MSSDCSGGVAPMLAKAGLWMPVLRRAGFLVYSAAWGCLCTVGYCASTAADQTTAWLAMQAVYLAAHLVPGPTPLGTGIALVPMTDPLVEGFLEVSTTVFGVGSVVLAVQGKPRARLLLCLGMGLACLLAKQALTRHTAAKLLRDARNSTAALRTEIDRRIRCGEMNDEPLLARIPIVGRGLISLLMRPLHDHIHVPSTHSVSMFGRASSSVEATVWSDQHPPARGTAQSADAPPPGPPQKPVLVYIHGGAWVGGNHRRSSTIGFLRHMALEGWVVVSLSYRKKRWPLHLTDCAAGLRWAYDNAADYGGDTSGGLHICGASAGGHISAMLAGIVSAEAPTCLPEELRPVHAQLRGVVLLSYVGWYPAVDPKDDLGAGLRFPWGQQLMEWFFEYIVGLDGAWDTVQPTWLVRSARTARFPPALILHGMTDSVVPIDHSLHFFKSLRGQREHEDDLLLPMRFARHGFDLFPSAASRAAVDVAAAWLTVVHAQSR